jgi:hypothetical protein
MDERAGPQGAAASPQGVTSHGAQQLQMPAGMHPRDTAGPIGPSGLQSSVGDYAGQQPMTGAGAAPRSDSSGLQALMATSNIDSLATRSLYGEDARRAFRVLVSACACIHKSFEISRGWATTPRWGQAWLYASTARACKRSWQPATSTARGLYVDEPRRTLLCLPLFVLVSVKVKYSCGWATTPRHGLWQELALLRA